MTGLPQGGFTLIEVIISIVIISIALVTLVSVMNQSVATAAESRALTESVVLAQEKLTMLDRNSSGGLPAPGSTDWVKDERYPRLTYRVTVEETPFEGVREIAVEIRHDRRVIFTLESYVIEK